MGSASSAQRQEAALKEELLKEELKVLAGVVRSLDKDAATSLEALSRSPDLFTSTVISNVRNCLTAGANREAQSSRKRKAPSHHKRKAPTEPNPRKTVLSNYFGRFELSQEKISRLVSLAEGWESQQGDILRLVMQGAPHWEKDHSLFWGKYTHPAVPSLTTATKIRHLFHKIEELDALTPVRRRLSLIVIDETIECETRLISEMIGQLQVVEKELLKLQGEQNEHRRTLLSERRTNLQNQVEPYQGRTSSIRSAVIQKLGRDLWPELPVGEREKLEDKLVEYVRWGKRYRKLPSGIILFLGERTKAYERGEWIDDEYRAVISYWEHLSGIYHLCVSYSSLMEALKQGYWNPTNMVQPDGPTELESSSLDGETCLQFTQELGSECQGITVSYTKLVYTGTSEALEQPQKRKRPAGNPPKSNEVAQPQPIPARPLSPSEQVQVSMAREESPPRRTNLTMSQRLPERGMLDFTKSYRNRPQAQSPLTRNSPDTVDTHVGSHMERQASTFQAASLSVGHGLNPIDISHGGQASGSQIPEAGGADTPPASETSTIASTTADIQCSQGAPDGFPVTHTEGYGLSSGDITTTRNTDTPPLGDFHSFYQEFNFGIPEGFNTSQHPFYTDFSFGNTENPSCFVDFNFTDVEPQENIAAHQSISSFLEYTAT